MDIKSINVSLINPEVKDYERAANFSYTDDAIPQASKAERMSKSIKDPLKLVRRSKAVVGVWGTDDYYNENDGVENPWIPFKRALIDMGFTPDQIEEISEFEIDEENL